MWEELLSELLIDKTVKHPFISDTKITGFHKMKSFVNRHTFSNRNPQSTVLARFVGFNKSKIVF